MQSLAPLIELASQRNLDLFFRVGQGYVARMSRDAGQAAPGHGLSPLGIQSRAVARIVDILPLPPRESLVNAWPGGPQRRPARSPLR